MFKYKVHAHSEDGKVVDYAKEQTNSEASAQIESESRCDVDENRQIARTKIEGNNPIIK